jgi:hypothetical protein
MKRIRKQVIYKRYCTVAIQDYLRILPLYYFGVFKLCNMSQLYRYCQYNLQYLNNFECFNSFNF